MAIDYEMSQKLEYYKELLANDKDNLTIQRLMEVVFPDDFFKSLEANVRKRIQQEPIVWKQAYLFQYPIHMEEQFKIFGLHIGKDSKEYNDSLYYQYLREEKKIATIYPLLISSNQEREIITNISCPTTDIYPKKSLFYKKILAFLTIQKELGGIELETTNFLIGEEHKELSDEEVEEYIKIFCQKENYIDLLTMLLVCLEKCQFASYEPMPYYIPEELRNYYILLEKLGLHPLMKKAWKNYLEEKRETGTTQLVRKLKKQTN